MSETGNWTYSQTNYAQDMPAQVILTPHDGGTSIIYKPWRTAQRKVVSNGLTGHCECSACNTPIDPFDLYCRRCGAELEGGW